MALLNLAVNARDAMPRGGVLTVSAVPKTISDERQGAHLKRGDYVCLSVTDTGTGMDGETLRRAIEPFFSTKGVGKGTGLGLSMVHGLAAQLGGAITISSQPDQGTCVEVWLPASTDQVGANKDGEAEPPPTQARGRALLVDDEELVRLSTADMLIDLGYEVVEAASGEEALALLQKGEAVDLLMTDHLMPGMSGVELVRKARELRPHLPVVIASGYAAEEDIGPDLPRLTKPFRSAELAERLADLRPVAGTQR
jgi:CheY-like chemotaxis protein